MSTFNKKKLYLYYILVGFICGLFFLFCLLVFNFVFAGSVSKRLNHSLESSFFDLKQDRSVLLKIADSISQHKNNRKSESHLNKKIKWQKIDLSGLDFYYPDTLEKFLLSNQDMGVKFQDGCDLYFKNIQRDGEYLIVSYIKNENFAKNEVEVDASLMHKLRPSCISSEADFNNYILRPMSNFDKKLDSETQLAREGNLIRETRWKLSNDFFWNKDFLIEYVKPINNTDYVYVGMFFDQKNKHEVDVIFEKMIEIFVDGLSTDVS